MIYQGKWLHKAGLLLLNLLVAVFGTAVVESPVSHLFHPHIILTLLIKEYLLSVIAASFLGFFVYRRWRPDLVKWVGIIGACWFCLRAMGVLTTGHGTLWSEMSGTGCAYGMQMSCRNWLLFTLPAVRAISYSAGAWLCWRIGIYGTSPAEDALLDRFRPFP